MRTGMSLPGLSAEKAAGPSIDEIRRKRIAIIPFYPSVSPWMARWLRAIEPSLFQQSPAMLWKLVDFRSCRQEN
jgi:hypothetical protein